MQIAVSLSSDCYKPKQIFAESTSDRLQNCKKNKGTFLIILIFSKLDLWTISIVINSVVLKIPVSFVTLWQVTQASYEYAFKPNADPALRNAAIYIIHSCVTMNDSANLSIIILL